LAVPQALTAPQVQQAQTHSHSQVVAAVVRPLLVSVELAVLVALVAAVVVVEWAQTAPTQALVVSVVVVKCESGGGDWSNYELCNY
jgi:hypothetical protein